MFFQCVVGENRDCVRFPVLSFEFNFKYRIKKPDLSETLIKAWLIMLQL